MAAYVGTTATVPAPAVEPQVVPMTQDFAAVCAPPMQWADGFPGQTASCLLAPQAYGCVQYEQNGLLGQQPYGCAPYQQDWSLLPQHGFEPQPLCCPATGEWFLPR